MAKPADVIDLDTWLFNYRKKKNNIVLGTDGSLLVLDPTTMDVTKPIKTIPYTKGIDAINVLSQDLHPELRVVAEEKLDTLALDRQQKAAAAYAVFLETERKYLEAVDTWETHKSPIAAQAVAGFTRELEAADKAYRSALYPHRRIAYMGVQRKELDYRTKDDRHTMIFLEKYDTTTPVERVITVADKA